MKRLTEKRRDQYFVRANYGDATMIYAPGADPAQRFEGGIIDRLAAIEDILGDEYDLDCLSPCILCRFNPPSSSDGKPCCMCPAEAALRSEQHT